MGEAADAYKMATEAGKEATKQLLVVTGGLLAGYLAFAGKPGAADVLDPAWTGHVIGMLLITLFLGTFSLAFGYLMHAARARFIQGGRSLDKKYETTCERAAIGTTLVAYVVLLSAIGTVMVTAYF